MEFADTIAIAMTHPDKGLEIRYTLDNSYPTATSPLYTSPIALSQTTVVRAAVFEHDRKLAERDAVTFTKKPAGANRGIERPEQ